MIIVFTTVSNQPAGEELAVKIVEERLAACVQVLPRMTSVYLWQGKLTKDGEHLLLIKTMPEKFDDLERFITQNHDYDVPEIVAVDAEKVAAPYAAWMKDLLG